MTTNASAEMRARLTAAGVMIAVALCGFLAGMAVDRRLVAAADLAPFPPPPDFRAVPGGPADFGARTVPPPLAEMLARELSLTPEQRVRVDSMLARHLGEMHALMQPMQAQADSVLARMRRSIDSVLTPAQRERAEALRRRPRPEVGWP